jgi:GMP synthase-like glutamine amidotransferase
MRVLVFQHIDVEHPGVLRDFMAGDGIAWDVVALDRGEAIPPSLAPYDALLVMGGPMDVWDEDKLPWLTLEKAAIRHWVVERGGPLLGICLGHQLLADVIGGTVGLMDESEVGVREVRLTAEGRRDSLFRGVESRFSCLEWHSATVKELPATAVVTAVNPAGGIEAFRYGNCAYGLQFHVEIMPDTVAEWAEVPAYCAALEEVVGPQGLSELKRQADADLPSFALLARRVYDNFTDVVKAMADMPIATFRAPAPSSLPD